jgi:hypothetical protein
MFTNWLTLETVFMLSLTFFLGSTLADCSMVSGVGCIITA